MNKIKKVGFIVMLGMLLAGCSVANTTNEIKEPTSMPKGNMVDSVSALPQKNIDTENEQDLSKDVSVTKEIAESFSQDGAVIYTSSNMLIEDILKKYDLPKEIATVDNSYKENQRRHLEQVYNGNIPVEESEVISLLPDELLAPNDLNIICFEEIPEITIDSIGIVEERGLHIRVKGIDGEKQRLTIRYPNGNIARPEGWFSDIDQKQEVYWNCFIMDILSLEEIKDCNFILKQVK